VFFVRVSATTCVFKTRRGYPRFAATLAAFVADFVFVILRVPFAQGFSFPALWLSSSAMPCMSVIISSRATNLSGPVSALRVALM
jgi:hypothetical protein